MQVDASERTPAEGGSEAGPARRDAGTDAAAPASSSTAAQEPSKPTLRPALKFGEGSPVAAVAAAGAAAGAPAPLADSALRPVVFVPSMEEVVVALAEVGAHTRVHTVAFGCVLVHVRVALWIFVCVYVCVSVCVCACALACACPSILHTSAGTAKTAYVPVCVPCVEHLHAKPCTAPGRHAACSAILRQSVARGE